jgi:hypothetical protein
MHICVSYCGETSFYSAAEAVAMVALISEALIGPRHVVLVMILAGA